jgi:hypothetical protein
MLEVSHEATIGFRLLTDAGVGGEIFNHIQESNTGVVLSEL